MTYVIALPCVDVKDRACVDECPVVCIYEDDLTEQWAGYYIAKDHPMVAALPPQNV